MVVICGYKDGFECFIKDVEGENMTDVKVLEPVREHAHAFIRR